MKKNNNSQLFLELATLIGAGIAPLSAAKKLASFDAPSWVSVIKLLEHGNTFNNALYTCDIINRYEKEIIDVAENAGRLDEGLRLIADNYEKRSLRVQRLTFRLFLPFALLLFAIVISAILTFVKHPDQGIISVLVSSIGWVILALLITKLLLSLMKKDACSILGLFSSFSHTRWYRLLLQQVIFSGLLWQVKSGIDFKAGFIRIARTINHAAITKKLHQASRLCDQGKSVYESVTAIQLPLNKEFIHILISAEQSGNWNNSIQNQLKLELNELEISINHLFDWVPRVYYALIATIAITVII